MVQVQTAVLQLGSCLQQYARDISAIRQHLEQEFVDMAKQCPDELAEVPTPLECLDRLTHLQLTLAEVQQLETQLAQKRSVLSLRNCDLNNMHRNGRQKSRHK